jgi:hypothetical protein
VAGVEIRQRVERPRSPVEVTGQHGARVARQQRVDPHRCSAAQVREQDFVGQGQKVPRRSALRPAASSRWRPPGLAGRRVIPPNRIDVRAGPEQRPRQRHLLDVRSGRVESRAAGVLDQQCRRPCHLVTITRPGVQAEQLAQPVVLLAQLGDLAQQVVGADVGSDQRRSLHRGHHRPGASSGIATPTSPASVSTSSASSPGASGPA